MNKCIVLILTVIVTIVDSNKECFENDTGIDAFKIAYYNLTKRFIGHKKTDLLERYYNELFNSAIEGFQERMLLSPRKWCDDTFRKDNLMAAGYKHYVIAKRKSMFALKYFEDLYKAYENILRTKELRSPKEFCKAIPPSGQPSMNPGQEQNQYTGEGSNRQVYVPLDDGGQFIDLNKPYEDEYNDEDLDQFQNAEKVSNRNFDLNF